MKLTADTITEQTTEAVAVPTVADIEAAFDEGRLYLIIDSERKLGHLSFVGASKNWDDLGVLIHVMSKPAGGEIRGYVRIDGALRLRLPVTPMEWPELDEVVSRRLDLPINARAEASK